MLSAVDRENVLIMQSVTSRTALNRYTLVNRNERRIGYQFYDPGVAGGCELAVGSTGRLILKKKGDHAGAILAQAIDWTKEGNGATAIYWFTLSLFGDDLADLFEAGVDQLADFVLELTYVENGRTNTPPAVPCTVNRRYFQGDEDLGTSSPDYPPAEEVLKISDFANQSEAEAGTAADKVMSPLRTAQALAEKRGVANGIASLGGSAKVPVAELPDSSESARGIVRMAAVEEAVSGTNTDKAVTPAGLAAAVASRLLAFTPRLSASSAWVDFATGGAYIYLGDSVSLPIVDSAKEDIVVFNGGSGALTLLDPGENYSMSIAQGETVVFSTVDEGEGVFSFSEISRSALSADVITAGTLSGSRMQAAGSGNAGAVTNTTQTFGGDKTFANNLLVNGNTTLGDASGDSVTVNAATFTAPNATSTSSTRVANVATNDARYGLFAYSGLTADAAAIQNDTLTDTGCSVTLSPGTWMIEALIVINNVTDTAQAKAALAVTGGTQTTTTGYVITSRSNTGTPSTDDANMIGQRSISASTSRGIFKWQFQMVVTAGAPVLKSQFAQNVTTAANTVCKAGTFIHARRVA